MNLQQHLLTLRMMQINYGMKYMKLFFFEVKCTVILWGKFLDMLCGFPMRNKMYQFTRDILLR